MSEKDCVNFPPKNHDGIISAIIAGFTAGVTCVIAVIKILGKD